MRHSKAFTLVELLVVIGIIAVLISILLPALNRARATAQRTVCATQIREICATAAIYATENRGFLPEFRKYTTEGPDVRNAANRISDEFSDPRQATTLTWGFETPTARPQFIDVLNDNIGEEGSNIGRLIAKKYLRNRKVLLCPALVNLARGGSQLDPGYLFNPHPANYARAATAPALFALTTRYKTLKEVPNLRCLVSETIIGKPMHPHIDFKNKSGWFNIGYADGHVVTVNSKMAYNRMKDTYDLGWSYNVEPLGMIEWDAAGRSHAGMGGAGHREYTESPANSRNPDPVAYYSLWPVVKRW